jgi:hypothetical protein
MSIAAVPEPVRQLADHDHAEEDQADDQHHADDVEAFLRGGLSGERQH